MQTKKSGATILEAMLYVGISSILLLTILKFFSESMFHENRLDVSSVAINDAQYVAQRIDVELHNAVDIVYLNAHDICIRNSELFSFGATRIYQSGDTVRIARGTIFNCSLVSGEVVSTNLSSVESLDFTNISGPNSKGIKYNISFKAPDSFKSSQLPGGVFSNGSSVTIRSW